MNSCKIRDGPVSSHGRNHSQTVSTIGIRIRILVASTRMTDFFCKNIAASSF